VRTPRVPAFRAPANACDTHAHIFGPAADYPFGPERSYTPEDCTADDYDALLATIGFTRAALVQGGAHGTDNRAILAAIARHPDRFRGVAVIPAGLAPHDHGALHAGGIRGVRLSTVVGGGVTFEHLERLAAETHDLGWHVVLHFHRADELLDVVPVLERIRNPFVLDHLARITVAEGITSVPFRALLRLLDTDRCYVKLASLYRLSSEPYPHRDLLPMIDAVVRARPDRIIWGSNWPHPILYDRPMPDDGDLVDLIPLWVPDPGAQHAMLVENPARLYFDGNDAGKPFQAPS
jgi:predicted TIM-barrel fold metal-dependent hydrolase